MIGHYYSVPCVHAEWGATKAKWWPVIGPGHQDAHELDFPEWHWHLDARFVDNDAVKSYGLFRVVASPLTIRFVTPEGMGPNWHGQGLHRIPEALFNKRVNEEKARNRAVLARLAEVPVETWFKHRRLKYKRPFTSYWSPDTTMTADALSLGQRITANLGMKITGCQRLDPDNPVCPHRKVDLSDAPRINGAIICPLHGLVFDEKTGERIMVPTGGWPHEKDRQ